MRWVAAAAGLRLNRESSRPARVSLRASVVEKGAHVDAVCKQCKSREKVFFDGWRFIGELVLMPARCSLAELCCPSAVYWYRLYVGLNCCAMFLLIYDDGFCGGKRERGGERFMVPLVGIVITKLLHS